MAYWVKVKYERNEYVVDLDRISVFVVAPNGRVTFWLPDSSIPIIINRQANADDYQQVLQYVNQISSHSLMGAWVKIFYDRSEYVIDLNRISSFCYSPNDKVTFWLPDSSMPIIITKQGDPDSYTKVINFIFRKTGHSL
ncbi:MAG: hypothetical protein SAL07_18730 [Oscillatoria sp. PMC 1051.18]|uniref:hypothetical protein n=1 Tax=Oscillatoria salina TaxID=331517 RepID=UPI0013B863ED|nr:hypothetical protein [Oscillatoria salina]MBZ8181900.1 hypothetical protein [Oscillatoria salina IIICB1]MEC4895389.1 hypothetical protein [Oscillatoria sp. PMC 1050.18]MEC5031939.1 hypothetical protein [Oscillatoria sp. PMC 1051.18]NET91569.1 hypothetical protein [Kamptonema sp. SIO1D9]